MSLAARVRVARRFQRAIRVDLDFGDPAALAGVRVSPLVGRRPANDGPAHRGDGASGVYLDRAIWHRQVEPSGGLQRGA